ncbi:MAG: lamin tail domain-containing protein [Verrucomicrobiota bacterium]
MKATIGSQTASVLTLSRISLAAIGLAVCLGGVCSAEAAVADLWRATDFSGSLNNGDSVASWSSTGGRALSATSSSGLRPNFFANVTPAAGPVVRFDQDRVRRTDNSPVAGRTSFSIAVVFRLNGLGQGELSQWYNNTGLIDAEQGGVTADWGLAVTSTGQLGWGIGSPDTTLYLAATPSLVDSNFHAGVFTWGDGELAAYLDNQYSVTAVTTAAAPRNNAGLAFGRLLTDVNQALIGDIVEVRFYDTKLTGAEATNVIQELRSAHIDVNVPVIYSFTASTNHVVINTPVTLAWTVSNATSRFIQPGVGVIGGPTGATQVVPRTNTTYTLIASNTAAVRTSTVSVLVDQLPPIAANQAVIATWGQAKAITLTGSDPQGSNLTYTVLTLPAHGNLAGTAPNLTYTSTIGYAGNDQFTFKVNDGEFDSPPATISIQVLTAPVAPTNILVSTTNISSSARPGSFIASFTAVDPNVGDVHTCTLVPGFGDNSRFILTNNLLIAGDTFFGTNFNLRIRATDSTALWFEKTFQLSVTTNVGAIVINEFHYNPDENSVREEFIELYNPTDSAVDVSQWEFSGAVNFTFPLGTVIPARQFLVVAQAPAVIQSRYGVVALGPWNGGLASEGEKITLEDANGQKIDEVDYNSEFPWPISADGAGASAALVHPQLDNDLGSSWRAEFPPTPGATNRVYASNAAPNIRQVKHTPQSPTATNNIVITAKVTDPQGVASVQLQYQLVTPGNYLPARLPVPIAALIAGTALEPTLNPAYTNAANWTTVPMVDNGTSGDALAADDTYTAVLPPQANRVLVRYRIVVTDALGLSRRAPFEDDPSLNFACFVYNGVPDYQGTTAAALQTLPIYTLLSRAQDVSECTAYNESYQIPQMLGSYAHPGRFVFNWPGTLVSDGEVYDNIAFRLRGANGRYQPGKRNWRFELNRGRYFAARDQFGEKFPHKWSHLTAGKGSNNRLGLTYGLNEVVNYYLWNKAGVPAPHTLYFHFRVVDGATEAPDQYNGDFWGLNWLQEDYDGAFLATHGLAPGNLYKLVNASFTNDLAADMVGQRRYQGPFAVTNGMDGAAIQTGLLTTQTTDWIRANVNVDVWYRYHGVCEAVRHYDFWPDANKNAAWYFEPVYNVTNNFYGRFWTLPWDTDSTWGATWNSGQDLVYNGIFLEGSQPNLQRDYRNTVRELRDLLFQPDQINAIIDAHAARIAAFVPADLARWSNAPASGGNYVSLTTASGFITPAFSAGLAGQVSDMKEFMFTGGNHTWWIDRQIVSAGGWITRLDTVAADEAIPTQPVIYYVGQTNYPMNSLTFECLPFADPQGAGTFAAMEWRLAEVQNTNQPPADPRIVPPLEWDAIWTSGMLNTWSNRITIPGLVVATNKFYRARVRHQDNTGRWSRWSAPSSSRQPRRMFSPNCARTCASLRSCTTLRIKARI